MWQQMFGFHKLRAFQQRKEGPFLAGVDKYISRVSVSLEGF